MAYIFENPKCPHCGGKPGGIEESILGTADIEEGEDGQYDYSGETEVNWDSQEATTDSEGRYTLSCEECGGIWLTHGVDDTRATAESEVGDERLSPGFLRLEGDASERDLVLLDNESFWITVNGCNVYIRPTPDGVAVELSPLGQADTPVAEAECSKEG